MKAAVVEVKGKYAIAVNNKGEFVKLKNDQKLQVGYEADVFSRSGLMAGPLFKAASVAAAFLLVLGLSYGAYSYSRPYSYVDIDINPSVEITANVYDRIIEVAGLNEDGKILLTINTKSFLNQNLSKGIEKILESAIEKGYLKSNGDNAVLLTVSSTNGQKTGQIKGKIKSAVEEKLKSSSVKSEIYTEEMPINKHNEAKQAGISPGKLTLIRKLIEIRPELKVEDLKDSSVKDIMKSIKESKKKKSIQSTSGNKQEDKSGTGNNDLQSYKNSKKQNRNNTDGNFSNDKQKNGNSDIKNNPGNKDSDKNDDKNDDKNE